MGDGMFRVVITEQKVRVKEGISARTNKAYCIREQRGHWFIPGVQYPKEITIPVPDDMPDGYAVGDDWVMAPESFYVGRFGDPQVRPVLVKRESLANVKAA